MIYVAESTRTLDKKRALASLHVADSARSARHAVLSLSVRYIRFISEIQLTKEGR